MSSWFKRGERRSPESSGGGSRSDTDPNTCLEVFQNHWKQACAVINGQDRKATVNGKATVDGVEAVLSNLEQMVTLLVSEDDDGGLPGPILHYVMEVELLESFCAWCQLNVPQHERLRLQQLRLFELIISQSRQMLLIHKPVIKPLLRLLMDVRDSPEISNGELEFKLVLVLHQICICISQQSLILESFFSTDADHGPARFLIFSLLIPYIHREGPVGQRARDALLLIMTLSARHPHIGQYIANNSDFCPVLATGLSGLYSSLPRKITPPSDDWFAITRQDCLRIPDLQMFLNSLQFSNAVVQVAHPRVRDQLIEFIYSGFLVPVLAPALHQDITGLPIPLLDTDLFRISREEVMTATAYLELFIRHVTDPNLLKAVLKFVLTERYDDVLLLDSLLSRITSNTSLSTVTLALFHTLIDLNCEDVMFQLVFRYLVPCTHVMVSQRRSVRDLDLYGKSAEKFLSLRPVCCLPASSQGQSPANSATPAPLPHIVGMNTSAQSQRPSASGVSGPTPPGNAGPGKTASADQGSGDQQKESCYFEYLHDARHRLDQSAQACQHWLFKYDGESPPPDSISSSEKAEEGAASTKKGDNGSALKEPEDSVPKTGFIEVGSILKKTMGEGATAEDPTRSSESRVTFDLKSNNVNVDDDSVFSDSDGKCNITNGPEATQFGDPKLYASLDSLDSFMAYLYDQELSSEEGSDASGHDLDKSLASLDEILDAAALGSHQRCSSAKEGGDVTAGSLSSSVDVSSISPIPPDKSQFTFVSQSEIPVNDLPKAEASQMSKGDRTAFEQISMSEVPSDVKVTMQKKQPNPEASSLVDISIVPGNDSGSAATSPPPLASESNEKKFATSAANDRASGTVSVPVSTTKSERNVPKDFPKGFASHPNPLYAMSASSILSPLKQVLSPGDMSSSFKSLLFPSDEFPATTPSSPGSKKQLRYLNDPPNIGPFLSALLLRLDGMLGNSLYFNLLLTDVLSRLAAYPQPLLRSFLLTHNLVFQPSVKSLVQVLSSLRQKLDSYSVTVKQFDSLVSRARHNLEQREEQLYQALEQGPMGGYGSLPSSLMPQNIQQQQQQQQMQQKQPQRLRADTLGGAIPREKKKVSLSDLIFRRSPGKDKLLMGKNSKHPQLQRLQVGGSASYRFLNSSQGHGDGSELGGDADGSGSTPGLSTWNAVYCALVLDEFLKELAALSQEHALLSVDEGYLSS
ncbi:FTS and Hook-interacting protein isoform X2 [Aplysia californica]|uniref:FTS and Hook-interacting protein isoform X2 n=1 Tax=Aplysia californica TaxID=6500 RepID=A0ABM0K373_APLCA|nr:FTS and Hook-interacting protein isoform X2 [Aplysia californica]